MLERETGVRLLERAGRGVRLTDAALVLVDHADALLERAALAEADLAASTGTVAGRRRIAGFQSVTLRIALPAMEALASDAPRLRCELVEAEPEDSLPALALGDIDLALGDEWEHQPRRHAGRRPAPRAAGRPGVSRPPRAAPSGAPPSRDRAARRARRRGLGERPRRDGLGADDASHLPSARRLRPRHPPPGQRRHRQPRAHQRAGWPLRSCPTSRSRPTAQASRCGGSPRAP